MSFAITECQTEITMRKSLVEIVKHYIIKDSSKTSLAQALTLLANTDLSQLLLALREIRAQVEVGKIPLEHYEAL